MDTIIANVIEKSLIGGAFIYMLHFFLTNVATTLERIGATLSTIVSTQTSITDTLVDISSTMKQMDLRITKLEERG